MPEPISASGSSSYDLNSQMCVAPPDANMSVAPAHVDVTIDPVPIDGDASRRQLVSGYDREQAVSCAKEHRAAVWGCAGAAGVVGAGLVASSTGVASLMAATAAWVAAGNCKRLLDDYDVCQDVAAARHAAVERCEARDGTPIVGLGEVTCLVLTP
jgi:hypothetical protein